MSVAYASAPNGTSNDSHEEPAVATFFVRALYDYQSTDASSLSFRRGDLIEVLTQLESGWWDGLLDEERGWFPSNYVAVLSDQEAEEELAHRSEMTQSSSSLSTFDEPSTSRPSDASEEESGWPETKASEFWMPHLTTDGQIYYLNTKTGQQSRDLPIEMDDESENHQVQLDQALHHNGVNRSRAGTASSSHQPTVGFGMVNRRSKTPEPWVKRLADDGMSFYYFNPVTGAIQWAAPVATEPIQNQSGNIVSSSDNLVASLVADKEVKRPDIPPSTRVRTESDASALDPFLRRASVYSDDSDVNPFDGPGGKSRSGGAAPSEESSIARSSNPPVLPSGTAPAIEEISPEHAAVQLQSALLPAPTETVDVLSSVAREAISSVVDAVGWQAHHSHRPGSTSSYPADTAARVSSVVISVRNLLYASGTLAAPLSSLAPQTAMEEPVESARSPFAELKPFQRKVTATLSKLVLSARAANSNPDWPIAESSSRVDDDATELERAVVTFVLEAQRLNSWSRTKRLYGVFMSEPGSSGVGPGLFGGGVGGSSKGLGFMPLLSGVQRPQRRLDKALSKDLSQIRSEVDEKLSSLEATIAKRASNVPSYIVEYGRLAAAHLNAFVALLEDTDVAAYVDVEGLRSYEVSQDPSGSYGNDVKRARTLIRSLEVTKQALYDDGTLLLLHSQVIFKTTLDTSSPWQDLTAAIALLRSDLDSALEQIDSLIKVADTQSAATEFGIQGRIGSKAHHRPRSTPITRRSRADSYPDDESSQSRDDSAAEDVVDMEHAFGNGKLPSRFDGSGSFYSETSTSRTLVDSNIDHHPRVAQHSKSISKDTFRSEGSADTELEDDRATLLAAPEPQPPQIARGRPNGVAAAIVADPSAGQLSNKTPPRAAKIKKFFGQEAPEHYILRQNADAIPWFLRPSFGPPDILINPDGGIRGGTLPALVERLTMHDYRDTMFNETFLMTFKSFSNVTELFDLLVERFRIEAPEGLTPEEHTVWVEQKQKPIRIRVMNVIRSLIDVIEKEDMFILDRIKEFLVSVSATEPTSRLPLTALERVMNSGDGGLRKVTQNIPSEPPAPIMPKSVMKKLKILDLDVLEIARQLTLKESNLFLKIRPSEILARAKESSETDNIKAIISTTNKIAEWVADSVLSKDDARKRALIIKHFILVAERCRSIHNFSSMAALIAGLNTPPIRRLKRTWEGVNAKMIAMLDDLEKTMDSNKNFTEYRAKLATVSPPCVPFLGVYLTTLTFIQDGNKDYIAKENSVINFGKRQKAAEVIREIKHYQSKPYNFAPVESIRGFLDESLAVERSSDYYWDLSLQREPREREDEKMARLLQESGFL